VEARPGAFLDDRFELLSEAGSGGMGTIWRARDRTTGEPVAVKIVPNGGDRATRFLREADVLSGLDHPGVVRYVAQGEMEGGLFLAMEWLEGVDLSQRLLQGRVPAAEALAMCAQVAAALAHAHARGVVHRDVKPGNLFLVDVRLDRV
jgi:serine/threonine protein kinase